MTDRVAVLEIRERATRWKKDAVQLKRTAVELDATNPDHAAICRRDAETLNKLALREEELAAVLRS